MSRRERVRISLNLDNPRHARALELLQAYDSKQRSEYVVDCVLASADADRLETLLRRVLGEMTLHTQPAVASERQAAVQEGQLPASMLSFLDEF